MSPSDKEQLRRQYAGQAMAAILAHADASTKPDVVADTAVVYAEHLVALIEETAPKVVQKQCELCGIAHKPEDHQQSEEALTALASFYSENPAGVGKEL